MPRRLMLLASSALFAAAPIQAQQSPALGPYLMKDRAAEVALARSAAPKQIADQAQVLVLTRSGYVEAARGTNGFTCFVERSFFADIGDSTFWNPTIHGPICLNPPAVRTVLPEMRQWTDWIMAGVNTAEIAKRTRHAYASHTLPMPAAGAMGYMLSPQQYLGGATPHAVPHLMMWFDKSLPPASWGLSDANSAIIDASAADPASPIRLLVIPVRRWSDGTPAIPKDAK
jgi:hypothetical protein